MKIGDYGESLGRHLSGISPSAPPGTALFRVAGEAIEMAEAYLLDGRSFLSAGDLMNGLAAFTYAAGWLDASASLGLFGAVTALGIPVFAEEAGSLGGDRVREKRTRYRRMLSGAIEALECSPDPGSPLYPVAAAILGRAETLLGEGDLLAGQGREGDSLACYSHGHGWLDAGVRAGLFRILHSRDLFTVGPL
ncbi:MAG TPA: DUF357 domain-containing protein [Methanomicrobiales archaeon]|nr:DUF357 domain-containing protein [Methanomicrobiales archaeon]